MSEYDNQNTQAIPHQDPGQQDTDQLTYDDLVEKTQNLEQQLSSYEQEKQELAQQAEKYKSAALGKTKDKNNYYDQVNKKEALLQDLHGRVKERDGRIEALEDQLAKYKKGTESNPMVHNIKSEMEKIRQENARLAAQHERAASELTIRDQREKVARHIDRLYAEIADRVDPKFEYITKKQMADHVRMNEEGNFYAVDIDGQAFYDEFGDMSNYLSTFKFIEDKFLNMPQYKGFAKEGDSTRINQANKYNKNAYGKNPVNQMQPPQQPQQPQQAPQMQGNVNPDHMYEGGFTHGEALEAAHNRGYTADRVVFMDSNMWKRELKNTKSKTTQDVIHGRKQLILTDKAGGA